MIKWILCFILMVFVLGLALDVFAQTSILVYDADANFKGTILLPLPPPQWR